MLFGLTDHDVTNLGLLCLTNSEPGRYPNNTCFYQIENAKNNKFKRPRFASETSLDKIQSNAPYHGICLPDVGELLGVSLNMKRISDPPFGGQITFIKREFKMYLQ